MSSRGITNFIPSKPRHAKPQNLCRVRKKTQHLPRLHSVSPQRAMRRRALVNSLFCTAAPPFLQRSRGCGRRDKEHCYTSRPTPHPGLVNFYPLRFLRFFSQYLFGRFFLRRLVFFLIFSFLRAFSFLVSWG